MFPPFKRRPCAFLPSCLVAILVEVLGTNHPLARALGPQLLRLTNTCWMADFKRLLFREPDQDFYADDFLLSPQAPAHLDHICPVVKKTCEPYFRRAVQALRTESPANAARWIGSLLHFVEEVLRCFRWNGFSRVRSAPG